MTENIDCPICLSSVRKFKTLECNHHICDKCLYTWFLQSTQCPVCRCLVDPHREMTNKDNKAPRVAYLKGLEKIKNISKL